MHLQMHLSAMVHRVPAHHATLWQVCQLETGLLQLAWIWHRVYHKPRANIGYHAVTPGWVSRRHQRQCEGASRVDIWSLLEQMLTRQWYRQDASSKPLPVLTSLPASHGAVYSTTCRCCKHHRQRFRGQKAAAAVQAGCTYANDHLHLCGRAVRAVSAEGQPSFLGGCGTFVGAA